MRALPLVLALQAALHAPGARADDGDTVFHLGEVDVSAPRAAGASVDGSSSTVIDAADMADRGATRVSDALAEVPGVTPTFTGKRNEAQIDIRGFTPQQVTLNIDGIPIYVPYDGNVDLGRLLVPGIARIVVTRGLGSLMYGPNNMGGSVNIVTQAPRGPLEGSISVGVAGNQDRIDGGDFSAQLGRRVDDRWYVQGGVAVNAVDTFALSRDFTRVAAQPGGNRLRAASKDLNGNLKIGFTPNATDDYALGIYTVRSWKQSPPYAGNTAATGQKVSYWDWPQWDKTSVYYLGNTALGQGYLRTRVYHDAFVNQLDSYDNANYNSTTRPYAFLSQYKDFSNGASAELGQPVGTAHFVKVAAFYKSDVHRETQFPSGYNPASSPWLHFKTETEALGAEDTIKLGPATALVAGLRHDRHVFDQAERYANASNDTGVSSWPLAGAESADNAQITLTHRVGGVELRAGIGAKTRFPGIKDMYSSALGAAVPNPSLGAERALNREIGIAGGLPGGGRYDVSVYRDTITDAIEAVAVAPQLPYCAQNCTQNQNVGGATNQGLDAELTLALGAHAMLKARYSYLDAQLAAPGLQPTNAPRHAGGLTVYWSVTGSTEVAADVRAASARQSATNGTQPVAGYATLDFWVTHRLDAHWTVRAGLDNALDRNYALSDGYPMPGRTASVRATYAF